MIVLPAVVSAMACSVGVVFEAATTSDTPSKVRIVKFGYLACSWAAISGCAGFTKTPVISAEVGCPTNPWRKVTINGPSRYAYPPGVVLLDPGTAVRGAVCSVRFGSIPPSNSVVSCSNPCERVEALDIPWAGIKLPSFSTALNAAFVVTLPSNQASERLVRFCASHASAVATIPFSVGAALVGAVPVGIFTASKGSMTSPSSSKSSAVIRSNTACS